MMVAHTSHALPGSFAEPERRSLFAAIARAARNWRRRQAAWEELERLSDRELQDIGISRADFQAVANGTYRR